MFGKIRDKEKFQIIFEKARDGILAVDIKTRKFVFANPKICEATGYSKNELLKFGVEDIHPKKDLPYVLDQFQKQLRGEIVIAKDMPILRKDGKVFYCEISAWPVKIGRQELLLGFFRDITEQRQMLEDLKSAKVAARNVLEDLQAEKDRLAQAKAKDEALLESMGEGVAAIDKNGKIIVINKVAEDLLEFSNHELIGKSFIETVFLEDSQGNKIPEAERPIILSMTSLSQIASAGAYYFVCKSGKKIPVAITATPILLDKKLIGAIIVFRDITKEKEIEKMRVDFLSLASHQLRTPLSGTKWLIDTMQKEILGSMTPKQKEYLNYIYQINERMIKLVSEMLNVLVLESSSAMAKKEEISASKLCEELFLMMKPVSTSKNVTLRNAFKSRKALLIESDSQILRYILENFISNAINYSPSRQEVVLDIKEEPDAVIFSVKDNGIGIPEEEQKRVAERFYRASNAKKYKPDGTGLGLYTTFLLAQKVGGKVYFESKENKGATFYLRVPKRVDSSSNFNNNETK